MRTVSITLVVCILALGPSGALAGPDFDQDGIADANDNCPYHYNPGQFDIDLDGQGDVCDGCPISPNSPDADLRYGLSFASDAFGYLGGCYRANLDGADLVNFLDYALLAYHWRQTGFQGDVDGDGIVDFNDMSLLGQFWLCEGPDVVTVDDDCPADFNNIQAAIDSSADDTIIVVAPGHYIENIDLDGKNVIVTGIDPSDECMVASTVVDGNGIGPTVRFAGSEEPNCLLSGLTITNGHGTQNGGGICGNGTHATISQCIVAGNNAGRGGGIHGCDGLIAHCRVRQNAAAVGGGLADCNGVIVGCLVADNKADCHELFWASAGGGLYSCNAYVTNCTKGGYPLDASDPCI
jgi:hypothetical protein